MASSTGRRAIPPLQSELASAASLTLLMFASGTWARFRQRCRQVELWVIEGTDDSRTASPYNGQVQQPARIEAILSSRHLPNDLDQPVSRSSVPDSRDEETSAIGSSMGDVLARVIVRV